MNRPRLNIEKLNGQLGRTATTADMTTAVVMNAIATDDMTLGEIYTFNTIDDVEALGLNDAYDDTNSVLVYHRLKKMFFNNPSIVIQFMPVAQTVTLTQMADKTNNYLAKLLRDKAGECKLAVIALNPAEDYEETVTTGLDADCIAAMYKLQELADFEYTKDRFCDFFLEGRSFSGSASGVLNLRTLESACPDVSVWIGADNDVSNLKPIYSKYASVEDYVSMISLAEVSQNAGEQIPTFSLTDVTNGYYVNAGLSSGSHINTYSDANLDLLNEKGLNFATLVPGVVGYHIVDTHTCAPITSDYAYVENNRTIKKAIRLARIAVLPKVKSRLYVDPNSGKLQPEICKSLEVTAQESLRPMLADGDISGGIDCYVNPAQNVLATSKVEMKLTFVPVAIGREITLKIGFNNPFKN